MDCHFCHDKIKGEGKKISVSTCHPSQTYYETTICDKCHHFPSNNTKSKETLIK